VTFFRRAPLLIAMLLLAVGVPIAIAADPSASPSESAATIPLASEPASEQPSAGPSESASAPLASATPSVTIAPSESIGASASPAASAVPSSSAAPSAQPFVPGPRVGPGEGSEATITLTGIVGTTTDGQGRAHYTLVSGGKTYELSDGPPWFWGDKNPLKAYVGKSVRVTGEMEAEGTEIDVQTVDGKAIRDPGKPPWAGGPWVVGPRHPGWKPWMADGKDGRGG
jgi:hypothetical protein